MKAAIAMGAVAWALAVLAQEAQPTPWQHFFTGRILPTPQQVEYSSDVWTVAKVAAGRVDLALLIGPSASPVEVLAARELAERVKLLSGGLEPQIVRDLEAAPKVCTLISLGTPSSNAFAASHIGHCGVEPVKQEEGYWIAAYGHKRIGTGVLALGADGTGVYWASKTLQQLLERRGDQVLFHPATVRDWPVFRLRSFKAGGQDWDSLRGIGEWCPNAKLNCLNLCYTTVGKDRWVDPSPEYRAFVAEMVGVMRARGLDCMPFVNPYYLWDEHIEVSDPADLAALARTCSLGPAAGGRRVMLCLDDFASEPVGEGNRLYKVRSERDVEKFGDDLAAVNVAMVGDLWERLHRDYPQVTLYVVPPYYWNPSGRYKEGGEEYLRKLGAGLPEEVRIVWTGPQVRSRTVDQASVDYYQGLLGRKVMLWDNTLYARHNPPHYLFDVFTTRYPERFWELTSPEVHYNAGASETYRVGLLCAASYLWNPEAYEPEAALREALAAVGGPEAVNGLEAFRDAFYAFWDEYLTPFGTGAEALRKVESAKQRWIDDAEIERIEGMVGALQAGLDGVKAACANERLVAECEAEAGRFLPYREAMAAMRRLPPPDPALVANLVAKADCEQVADGKPVGWRLYTGAGAAELGVGDEAHGGEHCVALRVTGSHDWGDGRKSINVAAMAGNTGGFDAGEAPAVQPLRIYYVSFWLRGDALPVEVSFLGWREGRTSSDRVSLRIGVEPFTAAKEWTRYTGRFIVPADVVCGALKIGINGWWRGEEPPTGAVYLDDVYVGGTRAEAEGAQ